MNRRQRKKQKVDHVQVLKDKWQALDFSSLKKINKPDVSQWTSKIKTFWMRLPRLHRRLLSVLIPLLVVLLLIPTKKNEPAQATQAHQRIAVSVNTESLSEQPSSVQSEQAVETNWREYTVKKGDTLAQVFRKNQLSMADLNSLARIEGSDKPLSRIKQGQLIRFKFSPEGNLDILQIERGDQSIMFFRLSDGGFGRSK
ncbi:LysM-like peptidoglycan-binding domain-containing protein [Vibrio barjaei]|uniref:LysM-like peptidoglycan-binding domain-containing protein n=1 Tax=Vibrio barjaei TaxID=1676683 RepID=UPI0007BB8546|nr:LysM-like peptidoglycan-binding domain-containing protein [Vibrio barjaei]OIN27233.1 lysine transporter LysM [Vibrio barjaei]